VKPENFSWKFLKYLNESHLNPTDDIILSDFSKIFNDPEPEDNPDGENLALILDFTLPASLVFLKKACLWPNFVAIHLFNKILLFVEKTMQLPSHIYFC
jgi:hypothetical protein